MPSPRRVRIQPEDLLALRFPSEPRISPGGDRIAYVVKRCDLGRNRYFQNLRLVEVETGAERPLTRGDHSDTGPVWSPDSRHLFFVSDRGGKQNLWRIAAHGGEPERLTHLDGRIGPPRVSPDGRRIAFLHAPKTERQRSLDPQRPTPGPEYRHITSLRYKHDGRGFRDDAYMHVWVLDLKSRKLQQITFGDCDDGAPDWSPDGRYIAFVSNRIERADLRFMNSDLFVVPARGGRLRQLTRARGPVCSPAWSPDGRHLAYIGHTRFPDTTENMHVWVVPFRGGAPRDLLREQDLMCDNHLISDTKDVAEGEPPQPVWSADGKRLFFITSIAGETNLFEIPAAGGAPRRRTHGRHEIPDFSQSADGRRWALLRIDPGRPGDLYVATAGGAGRRAGQNGASGDSAAWVSGATVRRLTRLNDRFLARKQVIEPREFQVARGKHSVHGWVLCAPGRGHRGGRGPAILMVHGGPYAMYGWSFFHEMQMLASHGYHVFYTNIRGSAGYGNDYMRSLVTRWGHPDYEDVMAVADYMEKQPFVDPLRMAIAGGSYGGYMTNWAIGHTRRFKCAITMRSISNLLSFYGSSDLGWEWENEMGGHPWENLDRYWRVSPLAHVANIRTPLLILHSDQDYRCPVSQAEELFTALKVLGRDVEMVRFLGESHGLSRSGRPHNRLERLRRILDWFERKL